MVSNQSTMAPPKAQIEAVEDDDSDTELARIEERRHARAVQQARKVHVGGDGCYTMLSQLSACGKYLECVVELCDCVCIHRLPAYSAY